MFETLSGGNSLVYMNLVLMAISAVAAVATVLAMFHIWLERKVAGHIQGRVGPKHTGGFIGWAQSIADGIKLLLKEDVIPAQADKFLFRLAPYLAFAPVFAAFAAIPFGPQFVFEGTLAIGVLYLLAVLGLEVVSTILAGWGSGSKWAVYGAMREACQVVSYEIPLGLSILCAVLVAGTLNIPELAYVQGGGWHTWLVFHNPFLLIAFVLYFIASLASNKRAPFDLPESESELVAGFHTEYTGLRFSLFFFAEYTGMFIVGVIQAYLFLGGWNSPLGPIDPIYWLLGYDPAQAASLYAAGELDPAKGWAGLAETLGLGGVGALVALNLYGAFWVLLKAVGVVLVQIWLRWTLPRIRIDQVLHTCLKVLLPAALVCLVGTAIWVALEEFLRQGMIEPGSDAATGGMALLLGPTPTFQAVTRVALSVLGVLAILAVLGVILEARVRAGSAPAKSFFQGAMPVSREQAFDPGANP